MPELVLASTSRYRYHLLARLQIPFETVAPDALENLIDGESPGDMAARLALAKAESVASTLAAPGPSPGASDRVIIGSDQVLAAGGVKLGKPGTHSRAVAQLEAVSGRWVRFHTGVTVLRPSTGYAYTLVETYDLRFRSLSAQLIEQYLQTEKPYDCAGSMKAEGLGIVLLESARGDDQTTLLGLPLIALTRVLRDAGFDVDSAVGTA